MGRLVPAREGDEGDDIAFAQKVLGFAPANGVFDARFSARLKGFQAVNKLYPDGRLTDDTFDALGRLADLA